MKSAIETLRAFNEKVSRLERTRFANKYRDELPEVAMKFDNLKIESLGGGKLSFYGSLTSWVPDLVEDDIDAFVLTYRMLTQNNDRLSLAKIAKIYESDWMHPQAAANFTEAREHLNDYLGSAATMEFASFQVTIRDLVDVVIYGGLAHSNPGKAAVFDAWKRNPAIAGLMWVEFMAAMKKGLSVFSSVKRLNEAVLHAISIHVTDFDD